MNLTEGAWGEHGLAGLVILALFTTLGLIVKYGLTQMRGISETHSECIKGIQCEHRIERTEWRDEAFRDSSETRKVIQELSNFIRDANNRT